jgi:hypothetical protein
MCATIVSQIFESSIAEDYQIRHVFMDLLVLADEHGVVDMTVEAIARRTNVPMPILTAALAALVGSDPQSRSREADGARLIPLDPKRGWGWKIVNVDRYKTLQKAKRAARKAGTPSQPRQDPHAEAYKAAFEAHFKTPYAWKVHDFVQLARWRKSNPAVTPEAFVAACKAQWARGQYCQGASLSIAGACANWAQIVAYNTTSVAPPAPPPRKIDPSEQLALQHWAKAGSQ